MRDDRRNYIIVGTFVVGMLVMLILWIAVISGRTGATDEYMIVYDSVMGLESGVEILFEGYPVGLIEEITPIEKEGRKRFELRVSVRRGWPVPDDSRAAITAPGLLSAVVINIRGGESTTLLEPGSEIESIEATDVFAVVSEVSEFIETSLKPLLDSVAADTPEILGNLEQFTTDMNGTLAQINSLLAPANVDRVNAILANLESTSSDFAAVAGELKSVRDEIERLLKEANHLLDQNEGAIGQSITDLNHSLDSVARHVDAITDNLESTMRNMNEFSRQIRENPGVIIRGRESSDGGTN